MIHVIKLSQNRFSTRNERKHCKIGAPFSFFIHISSVCSKQQKIISFHSFSSTRVTFHLAVSSCWGERIFWKKVLQSQLTQKNTKSIARKSGHKWDRSWWGKNIWSADLWKGRNHLY